MDMATEAHNIEMNAAIVAYNCGMGASEWEAFLTPEQTNRLIELGESGFGTWGKEPNTLRRIKEIKDK